MRATTPCRASSAARGRRSARASSRRQLRSTAAVYARPPPVKAVLNQGIQPGGQLTITTDVENYPGFAEVIQGPWLMEQMQAQAEHVGTEVVNDIVTSADLSQRPFRLETD